MLLGFTLASYAIVANDAIQTLGTFLAANEKRDWRVLWAYAGGILTTVLVYGWWMNGGDVSYGRLEPVPYPDNPGWIYAIPPLVLLGLTRFGIPVSTTFIVLTAFAPKNLESMVLKSLSGYVVAFFAAFVLYAVTSNVMRSLAPLDDDDPPPRWVAVQWLSTGFLWSQWLIQDLANIFAYLPRKLDASSLAAGLIVMLLMLAYTFWSRGGEIQKIVTEKTDTDDIRAAAIINFVFGLVLMVFKEWSNIPMSTTWVFLGLLAGREIALTWRWGDIRPMGDTFRMVGADVAKAFAGLLVSVVVAMSLPYFV